MLPLGQGIFFCSDLFFGDIKQFSKVLSANPSFLPSEAAHQEAFYLYMTKWILPPEPVPSSVK